jgi:hypothetical protein
MTEWEEENLAFLIKIGQIQPQDKTAKPVSKKDEE